MVELLRRFRMNQIKLNITNIVIHSESSAIKKIHWFCFFLKNLTQKNRLRYDKHWMESELSKTNLLLSSNRNCGFSAVVMLIIPIKNYLSDDVIISICFSFAQQKSLCHNWWFDWEISIHSCYRISRCSRLYRISMPLGTRDYKGIIPIVLGK